MGLNIIVNGTNKERIERFKQRLLIDDNPINNAVKTINVWIGEEEPTQSTHIWIKNKNKTDSFKINKKFNNLKAILLENYHSMPIGLNFHCLIKNTKGIDVYYNENDADRGLLALIENDGLI